jgi:hypothetical protein
VSLGYYALTYLTRTGQVLGELPLAADPQWMQLINDPGSWTCQVPIGGTGISRDKFLEWSEQEWKISVAICYGTGSSTDNIFQAGPLVGSTPYNLTESPPIAQLGGVGMWGMLNRRGQFPSSWSGASVAQGQGADTTYGPTSYQGIAAGIIANVVAQDSLPIDVPAAITGTNTMSYFGFDFATAGQRLTELATTIAGGPDVLFDPYFASDNTIRHQAIIGNPSFGNPSAPLYFDFPGSISDVLPTRDASRMGVNFFVKGNSSEYATTFGSYADPTLNALGWPRLDFMDSAQSSVTSTAQLALIAQADDALYGRAVETWVARIRADANPPISSYNPGTFANYDITGHPMKRDGLYNQRIIGFQVAQDDPVGEVRHLLQPTTGET